MKSIFPKAEETVILDILSNNDNNIQKTSDVLKEMGFERRDPVKVLKQQVDTKLEENTKKEEVLISTPLLPKIRTSEEKLESKKSIYNEGFSSLFSFYFTILTFNIFFYLDEYCFFLICNSHFKTSITFFILNFVFQNNRYSKNEAATKIQGYT